jgi:hypothetical protein
MSFRKSHSGVYEYACIPGCHATYTLTDVSNKHAACIVRADE